MKLTRQNLSNIAIAAVAVILFAAFVLLATKGDNKGDNLSAVAPTSTTELVTTTTLEETTTSLLLSDVSTTTAPVSATTAKPAATATTVKKTTPTTNAAGRPTGRNTVLSDNSGSFTHSDTSCVASSTAPAGAGADQLEFTIDFGPRNADHSINRSQHPCGSGSLEFIATLTNKSSKPIAFADGDAVVTVILRMEGASDQIFQIQGGSQAPLQPGESIALTQTNTSVPNGTFTATASSEVDYG
jgi:hypothetical protein